MRRPAHLLGLLLGLLLTTGHTQTVTYTVQPTDTLYHIATTHGTSVTTLRDLNHLAGDAISTGQVLLLPSTQTTATQSNATGMAVAPLSSPALTCGTAVTAPAPNVPLPSVVTGKVNFYAARYDPTTLAVRSALALGPSNTLVPLASAYKTLVVYAALRQVDQGTLAINAPLTTTEANRSIEDYSHGTNPLQTLIRNAIIHSENTAADIVHRTVGEASVARLTHALSPCTSILLDNKTYWSAQANQLPAVLPADTHDELLQGTQQYAKLPFEDRVAFAGRLNAASRTVNADVLLDQLDVYFKGPVYDPAVDVALYNTSTPKAYTDLLARVLLKPGLSASSGALLKDVMTHGCCRLTSPGFPVASWQAKAGSGWRLLVLTGVITLPDRSAVAYTYVNTESRTTESEDMEHQIRPVLRWMTQAIRPLVTK